MTRRPGAVVEPRGRDLGIGILMPPTLRLRLPATAALLAALAGCSPVAGSDADGVAVTLKLRLAGGRDVGATPGKVYVYAGETSVPRHQAFPPGTGACALDATPSRDCTVTVQRGQVVTLVAAESDPAVFVRLAQASPQDTVRDGSRVEFTGWGGCPDAADRGLCVLRAAGPVTVEANFQLMTQVTVYQTGAARLDWITQAPAPMLKVPAESFNILDSAGCRRVLSPPAAPCDSVRVIGGEPWHRFTAYVPRQTVVGMFPVAGFETAFVRWDGSCIPSSLYGLGVCSLITPSESGDPIILTLRFQWWSCPGGPSDRAIPGQECVLMGGDAAEGRVRGDGGGLVPVGGR